MTRGPYYYPSKGVCIYCGAMSVPLKNEHIVPYALGGTHVLRKASCARCEDITKKFEQLVARDLWGDARDSFNQPSRRKKRRRSHIETSDPADHTRKLFIPVSEYPAGFLFYKMGLCGYLRSLPETEDISRAWQLIFINNEHRSTAFFKKYGHQALLKFRHVPDSFGRLLAKIGYCQVLTQLDPGDFRPIVLPYILGNKKNISYVVGSEDGPPEPDNGYSLKTIYSENEDWMILGAQVRLYANAPVPTYHVVVGEVFGKEQIQLVKQKMHIT